MKIIKNIPNTFFVAQIPSFGSSCYINCIVNDDLYIAISQVEEKYPNIILLIEERDVDQKRVNYILETLGSTCRQFNKKFAGIWICRQNSTDRFERIKILKPKN